MSVTTAPAYRLTNRGVLAGEWTKFWSLRSSWITLAVSVVLLVLIGALAAASYDPSGGGGPGGPGASANDAVGLALSGSTFAALAVGVLGVLAAAGEYSTGMIRSTLAAVPSRLPVLWSKALIVGGLAVVVMSAGAVMSLLAGSPLLPDTLAGMGLGDDGVLRSLLGSGLYLGLVAVLGVGLGALMRSSAGAISVLAGVLLIAPGLVMLLPDSWTDAVTAYLPSNAGSAIMSVQTLDGSLGPWAGLGVVVAYVAVVLGAAAWRLVKTDA